ncbi:MAG: hypothetical protein ACREDZ_14535 [Kiloniellales bacterium]
MNYLVAGASVALFLLGFRLLQIPAVAHAAIGETRTASAVLRDPALGEEVKEARLQKASIALFGKLFSMALRTAACALVSVVPLVLAAWTGLASEEEVIPLFYSWEVIVATTIAFVVVWRWR